VALASQSVTPGEVQRPHATAVFGGMVSGTALTLVASPALYRLFERVDNADY
jgi:Cu/Ag efflux pump CusA